MPDLSYEPKPPAFRRRRVRLLGISLALLLAIPILLWQAPQLIRSIVWRHYYRQAMNLSAPASRVVYEEDPANKQALLTSSPHYRFLNYATNGWLPFVTWNEPVLQKLADANLNDRVAPFFLFAGWRQASGQKPCLLLVYPAGNGMRTARFALQVIGKSKSAPRLTSSRPPAASTSGPTPSPSLTARSPTTPNLPSTCAATPACPIPTTPPISPSPIPSAPNPESSTATSTPTTPSACVPEVFQANKLTHKEKM